MRSRPMKVVSNPEAKPCQKERGCRMSIKMLAECDLHFVSPLLLKKVSFRQLDANRGCHVIAREDSSTSVVFEFAGGQEISRLSFDLCVVIQGPTVCVGPAFPVCSQ